MSTYGYDAEAVRTSVQNVNQAYISLMDALYGKVTKDFVQALSSKWCCEDAVTFFQSKFKPSIDTLLIESCKIFTSVVGAMNSAASAWAVGTGSQFSPVAFVGTQKSIDVSPIKSQFIDGSKGVTDDADSTATQTLSAVANSADTALNSALHAVDRCGFLGGQQAETLKGSLIQIRNNVNALTANLQKSTSYMIGSTVQKYKLISTKVESNFTPMQ